MLKFILFVAAGVAVGAGVAFVLGETPSKGAWVGAALGAAAVMWNLTHK